MLQKAVELLLLFMGQPDTGGHLISCTDVVTASGLQHSSSLLLFLIVEKTLSVSVCVRANVWVCVTREYTAAKPNDKSKWCGAKSLSRPIKLQLEHWCCNSRDITIKCVDSNHDSIESDKKCTSIWIIYIRSWPMNERHVRHLGYQSPGRRCERRSCSGCCRCCWRRRWSFCCCYSRWKGKSRKSAERTDVQQPVACL